MPTEANGAVTAPEEIANTRAMIWEENMNTCVGVLNGVWGMKFGKRRRVLVEVNIQLGIE